MSRYVLVDDPFWSGSGPAPKTHRSWAMRRLFESGMSVGDIAKRYGVKYGQAYKGIHPEAANSPARRGVAPKQSRVTPAKPSRTSPAKTSKRPPEARGGRPAKERTAAELKTMTKSQLIQIVTAKGLKPGPYADRVEAALDTRFPGWVDSI